MNINQAKALAGIKYKLTSRAECARAERDCVKMIISARKAGAEARAAKLSEAKAIFQKRARGKNGCAVCGVTIARGATHCRIHSRPQKKMVAAPSGITPTKSNQKPSKRISVPRLLSIAGYYAPLVQKVVSKWSAEIGGEKLENYFINLYGIARHGETFLNIKEVEPQHWPAVFELGLAATAVYGDKKKLPYWLLTLPIHIATNDCFPSHAEIAAMISKNGGKQFKPAAIGKALERMKLTTSGELAKECRRMFVEISATKYG